MEYNIISTGSKDGNCVIIGGDVMIDAGVPFKNIREHLYGIKYLLITHTHQDHLNIKTMQQIAALFPRICIIGNYEVHNAWNCNIIANADFEIVTDDYVFLPFECMHDVLVYGYCWTSSKGQEIIYATDTSTLKNAPEKKYDYFFLESNHDENKLEAVRDQKKGTYSPYLSGKRHLSTQQAKAFYFMHRRSPESPFIELHQSSRFY
jgi:hypothetical protein